MLVALQAAVCTLDWHKEAERARTRVGLEAATGSGADGDDVTEALLQAEEGEGARAGRGASVAAVLRPSEDDGGQNSRHDDANGASQPDQQRRVV